MTKKLETVRQGDVLLIKLDKMPEGAQLKQKKGSVVLALGEATGHAHQIAQGAKMYDAAGQMLIEITKETVLTHEEHAPVNLSPGVYKRVIQKEYSPAAIRNVSD